MGVKDLWSILDPVCEQCSLSDLQGKKLAIDISGWIYQSKESQQLSSKDGIKPHLRILFWRLYHLVRNQVRPVVVFDGPPVKLKKEAIEKRKAKSGIGDRFMKEYESKFGRWAAECKEMLQKFHIPYVECNGDAEAACAHLNEIGEVDGCISDDSDCFLFGAQVVYTHFSCGESKVENMRCYRMTRIEEQLGLDRKKLVCLALLLGCDYGLEGVKSIGKEQAMRLLNGWKDIDPLQRMQSWRSDADINRLISFDKKKPEHCRRCRHSGSLSQHKESGCSQCTSQNSSTTTTSASGCSVREESEKCSCEWHVMYAEYQSRIAETKISSAALKNTAFPNEQIISAYLNSNSLPQLKPFHWLRPSYEDMQAWIESVFVGWNTEKIHSTLLPYFTSYDMKSVIEDETMDVFDCLSRPDRIKSRGKKHGRQLYEVIWKSVDGVPELNDGRESLVTWEFKDIFCAAFPSIAAKHEEWLSDKEDTPKGKKRKRNEEEVDANQSTIKDFFKARKRLNFDSIAKKSSSQESTSSDFDLIVVPECQ